MGKVDFGVLYGQKTTEDALLIYSSYEDAKASPQTGDFIVLTPKDEGNTKYLARVEAEIYDEDPIFKSQEKTLVAVHYARIAERELSERDKQKMFSYTYKVRILGTFTDSGSTIAFTTAVRKLPTVSYIARHLNKREIESILNKTNENGVDIGYLCVGETIFKDKGPILFQINKLRNKRTMVFAQSGFGKTNLVKVLLYHMTRDNSYGKLIFDLNGEYFLRGTATYGLGDIDENSIRNNVVVYTDKKLPDTYQKQNRFTDGGKVTLNMHRHLAVGDILNFGGGFSEVMKAFLLYLDEDGVSNFIENIDSYVSEPQKLHKDFPDFFDAKKEASARTTIAAIRKRIRYLIDEGHLHSRSSNLVEDVFKYLKQGKTVIIDLSLKDNMEASIISTILVRKLFESNKEKFTSDQPDEVIKAVVFVEEAQNVLSQEFVKSNANPFVRVAKEGRKFGLGLVAVTQRPSAISDEIRTQAENFFAFHMGNSDDIKALVKSNINYDGVISNFIQRETIAGNLYMVSSDQAFALPVRVTEFEKLVESKVYRESKFN
ncbi:ATP-binding protein [Planktothrix pseudagardhii]|uniref:DNA double-strand break repair helicase HerA n=1 Tax=Planktothrix pseudagardhii TaxID=132604 RepID=A0A9W4D9C6_9CYAN|nr:ATP-binding protein [Planktothrix pseudagardhii]CAD5965822.1 DNA double-strand break repair helicase HerA [Planktothrix pseudagardhii]